MLEQADTFGEIGAGIQIGPNAFHAMDYLGVGDAGARASAVYIDRLIMMDGLTGEEIAARSRSTSRSASSSAILMR